MLQISLIDYTVTAYLSEPVHDKTSEMTFVLSEYSDHPGVWSESLLCTLWVAENPMLHHADSEDWSDWVDAQADLSLCRSQR